MNIALASLFVGLVTAAPSSEEVRAVYDHYLNGSGVVLADVLLCKTVEKKDPKRKYECAEVYGTQVEKGKLVNVYLTALVPKDEKVSLMVQALHEGVVRSTKDIELDGRTLRRRTWKGFSVTKTGAWTFVVRNGDEVLKELSINVN